MYFLDLFSTSELKSSVGNTSVECSFFSLGLLDYKNMLDYVGLCWYVLAAGPPKGPASNPKVMIL